MFYILFFFVEQKPGMCPRPDGDTFGTCAEECEDDMDCTGESKCCSNGCGHACMAPITRRL